MKKLIFALFIKIKENKTIFFLRRFMPRKKALKDIPPRTRKKRLFVVDPSIAREVFGVMVVLFSLLCFLALFNHLGIVGKAISGVLLKVFGLGAWFFPTTLLVYATSIFLSKKFRVSIVSIIGVFLILFGALGIFHTIRVPFEFMTLPDQKAGGFFGAASSILFRQSLGDTGAIVFLFGSFLVGTLLAFQRSLLDLSSLLSSPFLLLFHRRDKKSSLQKISKKEKETETTNSALEILRSIGQKDSEQKSSVLKEKKHERIAPEEQDFSSYVKPSLELLNIGSSAQNVPDTELHEMGRKIAEKLLNFGVEVKMRAAYVGPTVTQFTLEPDERVKLSKITGLKNELALALSAESVRIEAPIPGKNLVGIEIPNTKRATVYMREILESEAFIHHKKGLLLTIGKDVSGHPLVEDLIEMPHLLVAGATGSGKSVGMNAFLISMLFENSPADLRFILIDPKRVELMPYDGIPHLLTPVITESDKALSALRWSVSEMMRRLQEFSKLGVRNLSEYNEKAEDMAKKSSSREEGEEIVVKKLPKIVIVIDELADLMMRQHRKDTEAMVCRIAQMARAVGMHLIIATQRPSVDVITGLIKANIPTRIAFSMTSAVDSRTVIDSIGAEDLLGRGDMLFVNAKLPRPKRIQGIYISTEEIERVVNRIKATVPDEFFFEESIFSSNEGSEGKEFFTPEGGDTDSILDEAVDVVRSTGKASASLLQRRLSIGYARAARILDIMETRGMIGPAEGAKARKIYL
jgi:DNA segregation ATPase FtsK/SpoIIIE, S-DNA-T family